MILTTRISKRVIVLVFAFKVVMMNCTMDKKERNSVLNRVYDGALKPLLASFIEEENLTAADIEELKQILDQKKGK